MRKSAVLGCVFLCLGWVVLGGCSDPDEGLSCGPNTLANGGICVPDPSLCGPGTALNPLTGRCESAASCARGTILVGEECVPDGSVICQNGTRYNADTGFCEADIRECGDGTVLVGDTCTSLDDALVASQEEGAEPNDEDGLAGTIDAPAIAASTSVHGCISPIDGDGDGSIDADVDSYRLRASAPVLLDISVDGIGGLAGAFVIRAESGRLAEENWERIGLNLVGDTSRRQVFLPEAGDYLFQVLDSRSLLQNAPAGSPSTCYFASLRGLAQPVASAIESVDTGLLSGNALFLAYAPGSDGEFIRDTLTASSSSAAPALVHMSEAQLRGSAIGGPVVSGLASGLRSDNNLIVVIEAHYHYSLNPVPYSYSLASTAVPEIQNGGLTPVTVGVIPEQELVWFEAEAGQVLHLELNDADLSLASVERDLSGPRNLLCSPCSNAELFYQASRSGIVYLEVQSASASSTFTAAIRHASLTPQPQVVDTPLVAQSLGSGGTRFFHLEEEDPSWNLSQASPSAFTGELELRRYPRESSGFLDHDLSPSASLIFSGNDPVGRIIDSGVSGIRRELIQVSDTGFDGIADSESFDLSVLRRDVEVLALAASQVTLPNLAIASSEAHHYLVDATAGQYIELAITGLVEADLRIELLAGDESALLSADLAGPEGDERLRFFMPAAVDTPVAIRNLGAAGTYDLIAKQVPASFALSGAGNTLVPPGAGIFSESISQADACTIESLALDIHIAGSNIGDMQVALVSPLGTRVALHSLSGGSRRDLIGSYPGTLAPAQSLNTFVGEEAQGDWTLEVESATFAKSIKPWQLRLYCQP